MRVDERVEAELGVEALLVVFVLVEAGRSLSMESRGRWGRCRAGAVEGRS